MLKAIADVNEEKGDTMSDIIRKMYDKFKKYPAGKLMFSKAVGYTAPYTGSIGAQVEELKEGYARVRMADKRKVRNHLNSIHAIAMMNLAEVTSGLAFLYGVPPKTRAILTGLSIDYLKKGRGTLTAECHCEVPATNERKEYQISVHVKDSAQDIVAKATAKWLVGPEKA